MYLTDSQVKERLSSKDNVAFKDSLPKYFDAYKNSPKDNLIVAGNINKILNGQEN